MKQVSPTIERLSTESPRRPNPRTQRLRLIQDYNDRQNWSERLSQQNLLQPMSASQIQFELPPIEPVTARKRAKRVLTPSNPYIDSSNSIFPSVRGRTRRNRASPFIEPESERVPTKREIRSMRQKHPSIFITPKSNVPKYALPRNKGSDVMDVTPAKSYTLITMEKKSRV